MKVDKQTSGSADYREVAADEQCDLRTLAGESCLKNGALYQRDAYLGIAVGVVLGAYQLINNSSLVTAEGNPYVHRLFNACGVRHGGVILEEGADERLEAECES